MTVDPDPRDAAEAATTAHTFGSRLRRVKTRTLDEMKRFLVLFLYLWVLFGLFVLNERIILQEHGINFRAQGFALINAFVLAKVMLVLEHINLSRRFYERPLVITILRDAALFAVLFILFHIAEEFIVGLVRGKTALARFPAIGGGGVAGLACVAVILFFTLIPFFAFRNFSIVLGPGRMKAMLFGSSNPLPQNAGEAPALPRRQAALDDAKRRKDRG